MGLTCALNIYPALPVFTLSRRTAFSMHPGTGDETVPAVRSSRKQLTFSLTSDSIDWQALIRWSFLLNFLLALVWNKLQLLTILAWNRASRHDCYFSQVHWVEGEVMKENWSERDAFSEGCYDLSLLQYKQGRSRLKEQSHQDLELHQSWSCVGINSKSTNSCMAMQKRTVIVKKVL